MNRNRIEQDAMWNCLSEGMKEMVKRDCREFLLKLNRCRPDFYIEGKLKAYENLFGMHNLYKENN